MEVTSLGRALSLFLRAALGAGCSAAPTPATSKAIATPVATETPAARLPEGAWFQPNGSIVAIDAEGRQSPELSAPIVPCMPALNRDGFYPPQREARERMADEASLTFSYLQQACAERYPIVRPAPDSTLTPEQARDNYASVARCSFETHYGKPYWVPQLLVDVDLCARELGPSWQLPTKESLARFNTRHRELLAEALRDVPYGGGYNSLVLYARETAQLTVLDLAPPQAQGERRAKPVRMPIDRKQPFQAPRVALRCVRHSGTLPRVDLPRVSPLATSCATELAAQLTAARASVATPPPPPEPDTPLDPALVRLSKHAEALDNNPDAFDPKVTRRLLEQALPAAKAAYAHEGAKPNQQVLEAKALRYKELQDSLEDPNLPDAERATRLAEFGELRAWLAANVSGFLTPAVPRDRQLVLNVLRTIRQHTRRRFARAYAEYKYLVVVGKPKPGAKRGLAAVEREVKDLHALESKADEISGGNGADSMQLPPKSSFSQK
jgi:hypothetical protein